MAPAACRRWRADKRRLRASLTLGGTGCEVMILAALFHIERDEYIFVPINLVLGGVSALIAYERWYVKPIAPASIDAVRVLKAVAVLGALVLVDVAPVWYRLAHLAN